MAGGARRCCYRRGGYGHSLQPWAAVAHVWRADMAASRALGPGSGPDGGRGRLRPGGLALHGGRRRRVRDAGPEPGVRLRPAVRGVGLPALPGDDRQGPGPADPAEQGRRRHARVRQAGLLLALSCALRPPRAGAGAGLGESAAACFRRPLAGVPAAAACRCRWTADGRVPALLLGHLRPRVLGSRRPVLSRSHCVRALLPRSVVRRRAASACPAVRRRRSAGDRRIRPTVLPGRPGRRAAGGGAEPPAGVGAKGLGDRPRWRRGASGRFGVVSRRERRRLESLRGRTAGIQQCDRLSRHRLRPAGLA